MTGSRAGVRTDSVLALLCLCVSALAGGCGWFDDRPAAVAAPAYLASGQSSTTAFTPARPTAGAAVRDFFWIKSNPSQPIEFPHNVHIAKGITCTDYCHESATKGAIAGLPGVNTCMVCHAAIATDTPRIQQITALADQGLDLTWQRVYGYAPSAHVRFNHAPHLRAGVDCSTCHGAIADQTVARRNVNLNMGYCVTCHRASHASNDCLTCHY